MPNSIIIANMQSSEWWLQAFELECWKNDLSALVAGPFLAPADYDATGGVWIQRGVIEIPNLTTGTQYAFRARVIPQGGGTPSFWSSWIYAVAGDSTGPNPTYAPTLEDVHKGLLLSIKPVAGTVPTDIAGYEIYQSYTNSTPAANTYGTGTNLIGDFLIQYAAAVNSTQPIYIWIRAFDTQGNRQAWTFIGSYTTVTVYDSSGVAVSTSIDFSRNYTGKHLGNIPDDAASQRNAVKEIDTNRRPLVDFTQAHYSKNLDNIADTSAFAKVTATALTNNAVDMAKSGVVGKAVETVRNPDFESGSRDWIAEGNWTIINDPANAFSGSWVAKCVSAPGVAQALRNNVDVAVDVNSAVVCTCFIKTTAGDGYAYLRARYKDFAGAEVQAIGSNSVFTPGFGYTAVRVVARPTVGVKTVNIEVVCVGGTTTTTCYADQFNMSIALNNLSELPDDSLSQRYAVKELDGFRRAIIDLSQPHYNVNLGNVTDSPSSSRYAGIEARAEANRMGYMNLVYNGGFDTGDKRNWQNAFRDHDINYFTDPDAIVTDVVGLESGYVARFIGNAVNVGSAKCIPVNPNKRYYMEVRLKGGTAGTTFYAGFACFDLNKQYIPNPVGASFNYNLAAGIVLPTTYTTYSGVTTPGEQAYNAGGGGYPDHTMMRAGAKFIVPIMLLNWNNNTGAQEFVDYFKIVEIDSIVRNHPRVSSLDDAGALDFSLTHRFKHLGNMPDDAGSLRYAVRELDAARRAIIDFSQSHYSKNLDNISETDTYKKSGTQPQDAIIHSGTSPGGGSNQFSYRVISNQNVSIASGDKLEYDVFIDPRNPEYKYALDFNYVLGGTTTQFRGLAVADQNGLLPHPSADLSSRAKGRWYHRVFDLTSIAGANITSWASAHEGEPAGFYVGRLANIIVTNASTLKAVIYSAGVPPASGVWVGAGDTYTGVIVESADLSTGAVSMDRHTVDGIHRFAGAQSSATGDGYQIVSNPEFKGGSLTTYVVYDNLASGHVSIVAEVDATAPNSSGWRMKVITTAGGTEDPALGGFRLGIVQDNGSWQIDKYHKGSTILWRVRANIPVGYDIGFANNAYGTEGYFVWLTPTAGTGAWFDYVVKQVIGSTGTFSSIGFWYIDGHGNTSVTWYVAVCSGICISYPAGFGMWDVDDSRRSLIDFAQAHYSKHLGNVADGGGYSRVGSSWVDGSARVLLDFSLGAHSNKNLRYIPDDAVTARYAISEIDAARRAILDFAQAHYNKNLDWVANGTRCAWDTGTQKGAAVDANGNLLLKNKVSAAAATSGSNTLSNTLSVVPEMSITVTTKGNPVLILFVGTFSGATKGSNDTFQIFRDGSAISPQFKVSNPDAGYYFSVAIPYLDTPSAASHTYDARYATTDTLGAGLTAANVYRTLMLVELG